MNSFEMRKPYLTSISGLLVCCLLAEITALPSNSWQSANRRPNATAANNQWNYRPAVVATTRNPNQWHQNNPGSTNNNPTQQFPGNKNFGTQWAPNNTRNQYQPPANNAWNTRPSVPPTSNTYNWGSNPQSWNNPAGDRPMNQTSGSYPSPSGRPSSNTNTNSPGGWGGQYAWNKPATPSGSNAWAPNNPTGTGQGTWNNPQANSQNPNSNSWNTPTNPSGRQPNWNSGQATQGGNPMAPVPGSSAGWNSPTNPSGQPGSWNSGQATQGGAPLAPVPGSSAGWNSPSNPSGQPGSWNSGQATQGGAPLAPVPGSSAGWNSPSNPSGQPGSWNSGQATQGGTPLAPVGGSSPWNSGSLAGNSGLPSTAGGAQLAPLSYGQAQPQQSNQPGAGSNPYANLFH